MIFRTPKCGSSVVNKCKIDEIQLLILTPFWVSFWRCFGSPNGGQSPQKCTSKKHQKMIPKMNPNWSQMGSQNGAKIIKNEVLEAPRVAPKRPPEPLQDRFWRGLRTILEPFASVFLTYLQWFLKAFFSSMLQTKTFTITRKHQKNAAESFQETASLFVPSCIEKFTSARQRAFRSLLVQVPESSGSAWASRELQEAPAGV